MVDNEILRIGIAPWPGLIERCVVDSASLNVTTSCAWRGFDAELLYYLLTISRIQYEIVPYGQYDEEPDFGEMLANGSYTGMLADIVNGNVHMSGIGNCVISVYFYRHIMVD
jgi:hypothetical protein